MIEVRKNDSGVGSGKIRLKGRSLLHWRAGKRFTQREAATFIGVAYETYRRAEQGNLVHLLKAETIARKVRIPLDELEEQSA